MRRIMACAVLLLLTACTIAVEPARVICRGDSVGTVGRDTALVACSTLDSLARR